MMHRAKRIKFEPSLAKARALESSTVRKCMEDIEKAGRTLSSCAVIPALLAECCERSIELLLVARLGLKGAECLRAAARMVPENFLGKRVEFVAAKVRVPNLGRFLIWDKAIFQGTLSCISTVYTAHTQHYLRYPHTEYPCPGGFWKPLR